MRRVMTILAFFFLVTGCWADEPPRVVTFTPRGLVKGVRQVRAEFSEPMVPFGDSRATGMPFTPHCLQAGSGRWVDERTWVFDFEEPLPGGIACSFSLKPGLRTLSGKVLQGPQDFSFSTGGPAILRALPGEGSRGIDEEQVFLLEMDTPVEETSLERHVGFSVPGIKGRTGVRVLVGEPRRALLAANPWFVSKDTDPARVVLLQSKQRFPPKTKVALVWGKGVLSRGGVRTETDQVLTFETREAFFARVVYERLNPRSGCIPLLPIGLSFSAPLAPGSQGEAILRGPGGALWKAPLPVEGQDLSFEGPFPENAELVLELPQGLTDDAGRPLVNADRFPMKIRTTGYPPLAKFSARFGILEANADPVLPLSVRGLSQGKGDGKGPMAGGSGPTSLRGRLLRVPSEDLGAIQPWLRRVASARRETSLLKKEEGTLPLSIPCPSGPRAMDLVGIPLPGPGLYIVEVESALLGKALLDPPRPMYVPTAVLVTNLSVHFKRGRDSSLVWVTALDTGRPVKGARVSVMDCTGKAIWEGTTDADGISRIAGALPETYGLEACQLEPAPFDYSQMQALLDLSGGLFVTARNQGDMGFVHSGWRDGIELWRFDLPSAAPEGPMLAHTVFDRVLLRAGETLHMKHILRRRTLTGLEVLPRKALPAKAALSHVGSGQTYELPLAWDETGAAESTWTIPRDAKLGAYNVTLVPEPVSEGRDAHDVGPWASGTFRVEEFRVPVFKATLRPPSEPLVRAGEVPLDLHVAYVAGGDAGLLPVTVRGRLRPWAVPPFPGFESFVFANGGVREGLFRGEGLEEGEGEAPGEGEAGSLRTLSLTLDRTGSGRAVLSPFPPNDRPQQLLAEMAFKDPSGEVQTVSRTIPLWTASRLVGIKVERSSGGSREEVAFTVAVRDLAGAPVAGAPVKVSLYERRFLSHRKRLVGGFYAYDHATEVKRIKTLLEGKTGPDGLLSSKAVSPVSGECVLVVEAEDPKGNRTVANRSVWIPGTKDLWFDPGDHNRMDLLPERPAYEPGETAGLQVQMPFRKAVALVTVEREGVLDAWVQEISGRAPLVSVPVKGHYAPNVFVSVLVVRGRTGEVKPTALADLGKPAFRLGLTELKVGWRAFALQVQVSPDRQVYKVREKAAVRVKVATADGNPLPEGAEVAVAAVDEGLLELMENRSWELLPAMMRPGGCGVELATAQMQVIGRRHFGTKALPQGGGGGRQVTRELFDTLLLWKARVPLAPDGTALVEVPLKDALTAYRITAVATAGARLFGTGACSIQSTQDIMVFPGLPPAVREGDRFQAGVTVRNASGRPMALRASARVEGIEGDLPALPADLAPGEARDLTWDVTVPSGKDALLWEIQVEDRDSGEGDRLSVAQKVSPASPPRVVQGLLAQAGPDVRLQLQRPPEALPGGELRVALHAHLGDGLEGVKRTMAAYPYGCLEQKISMAVALGDRNLWDARMAELPSFVDADGLLMYFPTLRLGDPILTAYVLAIGHEAGLPIPPDLQERMGQGLKAFVEGRLTREPPLQTADLTLRKLSAIEALSRIRKAEPRMIESIASAPELWPTSGLLDWLSILQRLDGVPGRRELLSSAQGLLRARLQREGTQLGFSTESRDALPWLMVSGDGNAARLLLLVLGMEGWAGDLPRLVQGTLARQRHGAWDLTTANAWGSLAMKRFSSLHEAEKVSGVTRLALGSQTYTADWTGPSDPPPLRLAWPEGPSSLLVAHEGAGKPWIQVQAVASLPLHGPLSHGFAVTKRILPLERRSPDAWTCGDVLRVHLDIEARADMGWVVVDDPIPAGATLLGSGLGRDSAILSEKREKAPEIRPVYEERSFLAYRAYYDLVPAGALSVAYTLRLNQAGTFHLPATRVEALYAPEVFGEIPNAAFEVRPEP